jgi:hypothetical protein
VKTRGCFALYRHVLVNRGVEKTYRLTSRKITWARTPLGTVGVSVLWVSNALRLRIFKPEWKVMLEHVNIRPFFKCFSPGNVEQGSDGYEDIIKGRNADAFDSFVWQSDDE